MTSVPSVSVPTSGVSARPAAGLVDSSRKRAIEGPTAPRDQRPEDGRRERRDAPAAAATPGVLTLLASDAMPQRATAEEGASRTPLQQASDAYRKAGAEPPRYGEEPRIFSVTA